MFPPPPRSNADAEDCEDFPIKFFHQGHDMEETTRTYPLETPTTPPPFVLFDASGEINPDLLLSIEEEDPSPKTPTPAPLRPKIIRSSTDTGVNPPSLPPVFDLPPPPPFVLPPSGKLQDVANPFQEPAIAPPSSQRKPNLPRFKTNSILPTIPPTAFDPPPTPSSLAPLHLTGLLQQVLLIMNTIMGQQSIVQEEDDLLRDLTELVVIMQDEAEALVNMADLVEEYVEEVDAAEMREWIEELDLEGSIDADTGVSKAPLMKGSERWKREGQELKMRRRHVREDSGIELDSSESEVDPSRNFQIVPYRAQNNNLSTPTKSRSPPRNPVTPPNRKMNQEPQILSPTVFTPPNRIPNQASQVLSPNIFTPANKIQYQQASPRNSQRRVTPSYARPTVASMKHPSREKMRVKKPSQNFRDSGLGMWSPARISPSSSSARSSRTNAMRQRTFEAEWI
ncbi:hypothetical protein HYFRA_00009569 [Hymenoscyphus fraxineus]|uniref:Uncharacterized protein n=1 Tax=Hymenoscyphus fraxineus TaxID=746836 RepID=A0A9N9KWG1_9HELO|nr:hypothetical protein HYFRA_00009569 [Hymenoscyphus fraxineus]